MSDVVVREAVDGEHALLGDLTVRAYLAVPGMNLPAEYERELRDVAGRARRATVLVAEGDGGELLGTVTYVGDPSSSLSESPTGDEPCVRMLAVAPEAQRRGVGEMLTRACVERAAADAHATLFLCSAAQMTVAHRLYEGMGFRRLPSLDVVLPSVRLLAFRLDLS